MSNPSSSAIVFSGYLPIEVTDNEYRESLEQNGNSLDGDPKKHSPHKSMGRRIGGLLSPRKKKGDFNDNNDIDKQSLSGISNAGQHSIASKTVDSGTTIKVSNRHTEQSKTDSFPVSSALIDPKAKGAGISRDSSGKRHENQKNKHGRPPNPWKSLKRLVVKGRHSKQQSSAFSRSSSDDSGGHLQRRHAKSHDGADMLPSDFQLQTGSPIRKRFYSEGVETIQSQHAIDQVIRGRLDGVDILSLGPASRSSLPIASTEANDPRNNSEQSASAEASHDSSSDNDNPGDVNAALDPLNISFTNTLSPISPSKLVDEMIWTSGGTGLPEIILEGYFPGGSDRWGVRIAHLSPPLPANEQIPNETKKSKNDENNSAISLPDPPGVKMDGTDGDESTATNTTDHDGSTNPPMSELWDNLWGLGDTPPPIPSHMNMQSAGSCLFHEDDECQQFAALCNVPIDLDDDAFIIDNPQHVRSVHELIMVPLQSRRFDSAISILEKLQRGIHENEKYSHLVASTNHNIGIVRLCQGDYKGALDSFRKAVEIRKQCLPADHPDIAVSLQREGMAHFALSSIDESLKCFEATLAIHTSMDNTRAKILNNIGVARYHLEDYAQALKSFSSALEIQRPWLEGPIRRESIVCSASTILSNVGKVYLRKGDHDLAYFVFEEACLMQTSMFRKDHDIVLCSMDNMARAHTKNANYAEALRIFTSLHRSQESRFGGKCAVCIETLGMMGFVYFKLMDYEEAEKCMKRVENWQNDRGMDKSHPAVQITSDQMDQIKRCLQGTEPMWV